MAILAFKPQIWAAQLLQSLQKALVYAGPGVVNRDYEGLIRQQGDVVKITSISRPTIGTYVPGSTSINPEQLTDAQRTLVIDQAKYFAFEVDDVDAAQAAGNAMPEAMREAAYALADVIDQFVAGFYTGVAASNNLGNVTLTATPHGDIYNNVLVPLKVRLSEANVPKLGRYVVLPEWCEGLLDRDPNFINAEKAADQGATLRNGMVGRAAGFDILTSNNSPNPSGSDFVVQAGTNMALSFAEQINKTEAYRPQDSFSDAVKGLSLYGAKLVRPEGLAIATVTRPAGI